ncbi:hypothetical protein [Streptomyces sp. NPDC002602]|uniref:hypothetical protein n=1 Tax=Streptomyces sp. NPDC002602 TaxID=3364654 RepID=UPI00369BAE45
MADADADADADGIGDVYVYVRNRTDDLVFLAGTGNAAQPFKAGVELGAGRHTCNQLLSADDRDGDGPSDLLARTLNGDRYLYRAIGQGRFADPVLHRSGWAGADVLAGAGGRPDFGKRHLIGRDADGRTWSRRARNNGQFSTPTNDGLEKDTIGCATSLDGSGIVTKLRPSGGRLLTEGRLHRAGDLGVGWDAYTSVTGPGDVTGDGHGDLLARDKTGVPWIYPGDGYAQKVGDPIRVGDGWNAYDKILGSGDATGAVESTSHPPRRRRVHG